jgi:hypothetical protein
MAGLDPAIHVFLEAKTWMPGTSPGMANLPTVPFRWRMQGKKKPGRNFGRVLKLKAR